MSFGLFFFHILDLNTLPKAGCFSQEAPKKTFGHPRNPD